MFSQIVRNCRKSGINANTFRATFSTAKSVNHAGVEKNITYSPHKAELPPIEGVLVQDFLESHRGTWGKQIAYECSASGLKFTHDEVHKYGRSFGAALLGSGLKRGDVAIVLAPNLPQFMPVLLGMLHTGIVPSLINPGLKPAEIMELMSKSGAKAIVSIPQLLPLANAVKGSPAGADIKTIISLGASPATEGVSSFFDMIKADTAGVEFLSSSSSKFDTKTEPAMMLWSSGTTGLPKGVLLTHENIVSNISDMVQSNITPYDHGRDQFLGLVPMFHVGGLMAFCFINCTVGSKTITMPMMDPEVYVKLHKTNKFTMCHVVPPLLLFLASHPAFTKEDFDSVGTIYCGGAPASLDVVLRFLDKAGKDTVYQEVYGMTETCGVALLTTPADRNQHISSVGRPLQRVECKVIDTKTGEALSADQNGEICLRGPQIMKGYLNNEEATRNTIDEAGWLHTGDVGYYNEKGYIYIVGRTKELIKVKGLQVSPSELEAVLGKLPGIADAAIIGVPDERAGELPKAFIVRKPDSQLSADDINKFLNDKVSEYKQLKGGIQFVEAIPRSSTGKILRNELKTLV